MTRLQVLPETQLRCGALHAVLAPAAGGRITGLWSEFASGRVDWLHPLDPAVRDSGFESTAWPRAGLYPLVPYSNRIRAGRFEWNGRTVQLPLQPGESHALHGVGQQRPWQLVQQGEHSASMVHTHAEGEPGWPWAYRAEHRVSLDAEGVDLCLRVTNTGEVPAPCGAGLHPYFPIRFAERLQFVAATVWPPDGEFLGTAPEATPAKDDYRAPRAVGAHELTQYYGAWSGEATLAAQDGAHIRMKASAALGHLVLYRPAGRDFFCLEPVSHVSDAANLAGDESGTGWRALAPGQTLECRLRMTLSAASRETALA